MENMDPTRPRGRSRATLALVFASGLLAGVMAATLNVAGAQIPSPTASADPAPRGPMAKRMGGPGLKGALHGEFTTRAPGGGYQRMATQRGEVSAVSSTSISVRSEDGFTRTYAVDDNTLVNAGRDGIDDIDSGDQVHVIALVTDNGARAVQIVDRTKVRALREGWRPQRKAK